MDEKFLHDDVLEAKTIGLMLINVRCAEHGADALSVDDFYDKNIGNREIFLAIKDLKEKGDVIDATTVATQLKQNKAFEKAGGVDRFAELIDQVLLPNNFESYVKKLKDFSTLRKALRKCEELVNTGTKKKVEDIPLFLTRIENQINEITSQRRSEGFASVKDLSKSVGKSLREKKSFNELPGIKTGFLDLDKKTGGIDRGQMIVLAARPGVGKSALALNIVYNYAKNSGNTVAYFSFEMGIEEMMKRLFSISARVDQNKIMTNSLSQNEKAAIFESERLFQGMNILFEENATTTIDDIVIKCKKLKEERDNLGLIVVDHIGIIQEGEKKFKSDQEKIAYFSRRLKTLAIEIMTPLICVCHINRDADKKNSRIPELSELRGSGALENDCDKALLLYREGYYKDQGIDIQSKKGYGDLPSEEEDNGKVDDRKGQIMQVNIAKNRQGQMGKIDLLFFPSMFKFENLSEETKAKLKENS